MPLTALDVSQKQFNRAFRGLHPEEVQAFLAEAAGTIEALTRETQTLRDDLARRGDEIDGYKGRERMLHETLLTAQKARGRTVVQRAPGMYVIQRIAAPIESER